MSQLMTRSPAAAPLPVRRLVGARCRWAFLLIGACAATDPDPAASRPEDPGQQAPAPEPAAARGPYPVGARTLEITDNRGQELVIEVWYPAVIEEGDAPDPYPPTTLARDAFRDVPADLRGAPYPLIAFSHGLGAIRYQSIYLTEHLASHGFVVLAPDHPGSTLFDLDGSGVVDSLVSRPGDVQAAVDELLRRSDDPDDPWATGLVESDAYVAIGHSFGAFTSLVLGGGQLDYRGVEAYCASHSSLACTYANAEDPGAVQQRIEASPTVDERVVAVVPLSPGLWYAFGVEGEGLSALAPSLLLAGDRDQIIDYEEARGVWERAAAPSILGTFARAGHYAFSDICALAPVLAADCEGEAGGWAAMEEAQAASAALVTAFAREALVGGIEGDAKLLRPDTWVDDPLVTLEVGAP